MEGRTRPAALKSEARSPKPENGLIRGAAAPLGELWIRDCELRIAFGLRVSDWEGTEPTLARPWMTPLTSEFRFATARQSLLFGAVERLQKAATRKTMATLTKLKLSFKTGSEPFSGTNARVYLVFCSRTQGRIYELPTQPGDLEVGKLDIYEAEGPEGPDWADLTCLLLLNGMNQANAAWRVLWVKIEAVDANGASWLLADSMLERWLDNAKGTAPAAFVPLKQPLTRLADDVVGRPSCSLKLVP